MDEKQTATLDCWAIVEMFGHQRIAGKVRSENFGAAVLIRVDVPEIQARPNRTYDYERKEYIEEPGPLIASFTKYIGVASIYALNPVTEELARAAARDISAAPISLFGFESIRKAAPLLPGESTDAEESDEDEGIDGEDEIKGQDSGEDVLI